MSTPVDKRLERLTELLADEAIVGLEQHERSELEEMFSDGIGLGRDDFMKVAGLVQIGLLEQDRFGQQRMPESLRRKLVEQGQAVVANRTTASNDAIAPGAPQDDKVTPLRPRSGARTSRVENSPRRPAGCSQRCSRWHSWCCALIRRNRLRRPSSLPMSARSAPR